MQHTRSKYVANSFQALMVENTTTKASMAKKRLAGDAMGRRALDPWRREQSVCSSCADDHWWRSHHCGNLRGDIGRRPNHTGADHMAADSNPRHRGELEGRNRTEQWPFGRSRTGPHVLPMANYGRTEFATLKSSADEIGCDNHCGESSGSDVLVGLGLSWHDCRYERRRRCPWPQIWR